MAVPETKVSSDFGVVVAMDDKSSSRSVESCHEDPQRTDTGDLSLRPEEKRAERRFLLKADLRIMPMATFVYLLSSLVGQICHQALQKLHRW